MLYLSNNKLSKEENFKKATPLIISSKTIRYLGIISPNLTNQVKDLYAQNIKTLMKETEDDTINEKIMVLMDWGSLQHLTF